MYKVAVFIKLTFRKHYPDAGLKYTKSLIWYFISLYPYTLLGLIHSVVCRNGGSGLCAQVTGSKDQKTILILES